MRGIGIFLLMTAVGQLSASAVVWAQGRPAQGPPPAPVVVAEVRSGNAASTADFVGTVHFAEVSDVAAEVGGRVEEVGFEEGQRVKKGQQLVRVNAELLEKTIEGTSASRSGLLSDLQKARSDLKRIDTLYRKEVVQEQLHDEHFYRVKSLESQVDALRAEVERLRLELQRKTIEAPFDGVVIRKHVDTGEWLSPGSVIGTVARDETVDVTVDVPEAVMRSLRPGAEARVRVGGQEIVGRIFAIIPRGDVATRTFPVKVRAENSLSLAEGMEAVVSFPMGGAKPGLLLPRDAVIEVMGRSVVFTVVNGKAAMVPVEIIRYDGTQVEVNSEGLEKGMRVVIKGNERLRADQPVIVLDRGP